MIINSDKICSKPLNIQTKHLKLPYILSNLKKQYESRIIIYIYIYLPEYIPNIKHIAETQVINITHERSKRIPNQSAAAKFI